MLKRIEEVFRKVNITPVQKIDKSKLETMLILIKNKEKNDLYNLSEEDYVVSLFSERTGGYYINDWEMPDSLIELEDIFRTSIVMYYGTKRELNFYYRVAINHIYEKISQEQFALFLELFSKKDALRWNFSRPEQRMEILKSALYMYTKALGEKQNILSRLTIELPKAVIEGMREG